jgi:hypothetical protein
VIISCGGDSVISLGRIGHGHVNILVKARGHFKDSSRVNPIKKFVENHILPVALELPETLRMHASFKGALFQDKIQVAFWSVEASEDDIDSR